MADNNSFFSKKIKAPSSFDGIFDGDGYNSFYVAGVEVARVDAQGLKLSSGTAIRQGDAPAGGEVVVENTDSSVNTPVTLVASQSGQWFCNSGAAKRSFVLPAAQAGLRFNFLCTDADGLRIVPNSLDTIRFTVATSLPGAGVSVICTPGSYAESTMLSASMQLLCVSSVASNAWQGIAITGVWSPLV